MKRLDTPVDSLEKATSVDVEVCLQQFPTDEEHHPETQERVLGPQKRSETLEAENKGTSDREPAQRSNNQPPEESTRRIPIIPHHNLPTQRRLSAKSAQAEPEPSEEDVANETPEVEAETPQASEVPGDELARQATWAPKPSSRRAIRKSESHEGSDFSSPSSYWQPSAESMPDIGDCIFGFRIRQALGEGSFARVFLAEQADLAERQVVLKISQATGEEAQTLAQLQHTNIVPIYSLHEDRGAGLRALCMPYVGGASASAVLKEFWTNQPSQPIGKDLADALRKVSGPLPIRMTIVGADEGDSGQPDDGLLGKEELTDTAHQGPAEVIEKSTREGDLSQANGTGKPSRMTREASIPWESETYVRSIVWLISRLARGLQHAHDRGIMHRDIKPSNILIAADGEPMLLDFNISQKLEKRPRRGEGSDLSGTIAYMSPEHLQALALQDSELANKIGHRSDIYSLGLVFYEMLVGKHPFAEVDTKHHNSGGSVLQAIAHTRYETTPEVREHRPDALWGVESIVRQCLSPDPTQRYQHAAELAEDCERLLEDRPLRFAPELSIVEQVQKWVRRHPRFTTIVGMVLLVIAITTGFVALWKTTHRNLVQIQNELILTQSRDRLRNFDEDTKRSLCLLHTFGEMQDHVDEGIRVCEKALGHYQVIDNEAWQETEEWKQLSKDQQITVAQDIQELMILLAFAKIQVAGKGKQPDHEAIRQALDLIKRAETIPGVPPSQVLWKARERFFLLAGKKAEAEKARRQGQALPPKTARDYYLLATTETQQGRYTEAVVLLDKALELSPTNYWARMQRGICHLELKQHPLAIADFGGCIGLWPKFAWGYFNLGYSLDRSGHSQQAVAEYTKALALDPDFATASMNRGTVYLELQQYSKAVQDFEKVVEMRGSREALQDAELQASLGTAYEKIDCPKKADLHFALATEHAASLEKTRRHRVLLSIGFAVSERSPEKAKRLFTSVLKDNRNQTEALFGQAMLHAQKEENNKAIGVFNNILWLRPQFEEARRYRAVLLARIGKLELAKAEINRCLDMEPFRGGTYYAGACVASLALPRISKTDVNRKAQVETEAVKFLEAAFAKGYGINKAKTDPDLHAIQQNKRVQELLTKFKAK
ncbi:MAG: protein kinase [Gemmataceae bacterium]